MTRKLLSIDVGTTSTRAIIFNENGGIESICQNPIDLIYPQDGWVEQDPQALVEKTIDAVRKVLGQEENLSDVIAAGITNQRETTILWDKKTGEPVYNAIVWQDRRTAKYCATLKRANIEEMVQEKTGLLLDPYFSATKIKWILDNVEGARARAENGNLLFGTVDCYVLWHLTGGRVHATDVTNASRTMLYNIIGQNWDRDLLKLFDIPKEILPIVNDNIFDYGRIDADVFQGDIPIGGMAGDQQSALVGQGCVHPNMAKSTYGTGCFALVNIGSEVRYSKHKLLTTIGYKIGDDIAYAIEGSIFNAGTAIQFLRDNLGLFADAGESDAMARAVKDNGEVYFVPAFTGLGAPYWNPDARGVLTGITRDTSKEHIVRAALEAQGYQTRDLMDAMERDSGAQITTLRADGGLTSNDFMCQFLSDILDVAVEVPRVSEATAWGAAYLAGLQYGVFSSLGECAGKWSAQKTYHPKAQKTDMDTLYSKWKVAVEKTF